MKKTVVIGASLNPERTAHLAVIRLHDKGHEVIAIGLREGVIGEINVVVGTPDVQHVDTVSLYLNQARQAELIDYVFSLKPKRIIFNPGTENPMFMQRAIDKGIDAFEACTLTMLAIGAY